MKRGHDAGVQPGIDRASCRERETRPEHICGSLRDCRCGTLLLYSPLGTGLKISNYVSDLWSYGDLNPRPLACHATQAPSRPGVLWLLPGLTVPGGACECLSACLGWLSTWLSEATASPVEGRLRLTLVMTSGLPCLKQIARSASRLGPAAVTATHTPHPLTWTLGPRNSTDHEGFTPSLETES
jgi:hypothetical protein